MTTLPHERAYSALSSLRALQNRLHGRLILWHPAAQVTAHFLVGQYATLHQLQQFIEKVIWHLACPGNSRLRMRHARGGFIFRE